MKALSLNKPIFYILSFTWGLPLTLIGLTVALVLLLGGKRPTNYCGRLHFSFGERWGGVSLGVVFLTQNNAADSLRNHECGHTVQNCLLGPFMPFLVALPSMCRYWWRHFQRKAGKPPKKPYDAVWFERQATQWGNSFIKRL